MEPKKLDAKEVKDKIKNFLDMAGPSLPINVGKHIGINTLFTSAFLSEMAAEGLVKISDMKVGGSPLYYTPNRIHSLENFIIYLGGKEKEACQLLKEKFILENSEQHPAIRVALRSLKDFAFPFKKDDKIYWRYFKISENEALERLDSGKSKPGIEQMPQLIREIQPIVPEKAKPNIEMEEMNRELDKKKKELEQLKQELEKSFEERRKQLVNENEEIKKQNEEKQEKKALFEKESLGRNNNKITKEKKIKLKPEEKFLIEIKELLQKKNIELIHVERIDKKEIYAKINFGNKEFLLAAFDKKKVEDSDLMKAYKKSQLLGLAYVVFAKGDLSKKTREAIDAYRKLAAFEKIEERTSVIGEKQASSENQETLQQ